MDDCIFCKLICGELPAMKVCEDEYSLVFMGAAKDVDGHILAVPKKHCMNIMECDEASLLELMRTVKKVSEHLVEKCGYEGVNLLNASGGSAGQSVHHFHIHIIPRKGGDNIDAWPHFEGAKRETEEVFREIKIL